MITDIQRKNLIDLADFLDRHVPPPNFGMNCFVKPADIFPDNDDPNENPNLATPEVYNQCGTVACAVGHGPLMGLKPLPEDTWYDYSYRNFGATMTYSTTTGERVAAESDDLWAWLFDGRWHQTDNTAKGAAARIRWYLENGTPENARDMRRGEVPLCYKVEE